MRKGFVCFLLAVAFCFGLYTPVFAQGKSSSVTILFTSDIHSHIESAARSVDNAVEQYGGFVALSNYIKDYKSIDPNLLLLDAGDFSMGTLYQTIFTTQAPELRLMGALGYDAVTFGNHEFDFGTSGLTKMLAAAVRSNDQLPQIVVSNLTQAQEPTEEQSALYAAMQQAGAKKYTIIERNGFKIGVFSLMGENASSYISAEGIGFDDRIVSAKNMIASIEAAGGADMIVCLSHSGTDTDQSKSEDEILASAVPEIDLIISGHAHTTLEQPIRVGNTTIVAPGSYMENLGAVELTIDGEGHWTPSAYSLIRVTPREGDEDKVVEDRVKEFSEYVNSTYLEAYGLTADQVIAKSAYSMQTIGDMVHTHAESPLGNLFADAYAYAAKELCGIKPDVTLVNAGMIRSSFTAGDITASDIFAASPLGIGQDGKCTYPLACAYITGSELKNVVELDASMGGTWPDVQLFFSGLKYTFNPNRLIFNRTVYLNIEDEEGAEVQVEDEKLYCVVMDYFLLSNVALAAEKSFGIVNIVPKNASGEPVEDLTSLIMHDSSGAELKSWLALVSFMQSFDAKDEVPQLPSYYGKTHERKINDEGASIIANLNWVTYTAIGASAAVLALIVFIIYRIATHTKRKQKKQLKKVAKK